MKKYVILFCCTLAGVALALSIPGLASLLAPEVEVLVVKPDDIETAVLCTGKIEAAEEANVTLSVPVKPQRIEVEAGDRVTAGQLLFTVDRDATVQAMARPDAGGAPSGAQNAPPAGGSASGDPIPERVEAPFDGIVTALNVSADRVAEASSVLATIAKSESLQVRMSISESLISSVRVGQRVIITGSGFQGVEYGGQILKVFSSARETAAGGGDEVVVEAIARIFSPDERLKPGFTAKVRIITEVGSGVITVPYEAVMEEDGEEYVYVAFDHWLHKRSVETGRDTDAGLEILSGLKAGDLIAAHPDAVKRPNARIDPVIAGEG